MRVQFNRIHRAFHWVEEDPWRYCYSFSIPNEWFSFIVEWLAKRHEATSQRALAPAVAVVAEASIPVHDKGKRKILDCMRRRKVANFKQIH